MFEEALRKAPREELVEHIQLQRELIRRLHRRVIELEASLESACAASKNVRVDADESAAALPVKGATCAAEEQRLPRTASSHEREVANAALTLLSPRARAYASSLASSKLRSPSALPLPPRKRTTTATTNIANDFGDECTSAAPEPRRELPMPHTEEHLSRVSSSSPLRPSTRAMPAPTEGAMPSVHTYAKPSSAAGSSSVDHPTVLEGVREINYVLAAHRVGRPALPLSVVEELEEIRNRLLQGFKQMLLSAGSPAEDDRANEELASWTSGERLPDDSVHSRAHDILQSCGVTRGKAEVDRVRPRWVSPDASRVVYGESPHRGW
ncbi:hypothetical protein ABL78_5437 [Leptomonas seymouri]|uniref:Uncharacterized protein n=1 Tax=Leptomonas seymouri TaxID=5684 RepID=A0A0N0P529_LEPSE|nr:hypothetical protein ABL78_5437 [Leptomonas seymouri]|eukprot:KPI85517.1 hypothetical protein ABL78_5437 [Leptomonas seymouri]